MDKTNRQLSPIFGKKETVVVKFIFTLGLLKPAEELTRMFVAQLLTSPLACAKWKVNKSVLLKQ